MATLYYILTYGDDLAHKAGMTALFKTKGDAMRSLEITYSRLEPALQRTSLPSKTLVHHGDNLVGIIEPVRLLDRADHL